MKPPLITLSTGWIDRIRADYATAFGMGSDETHRKCLSDGTPELAAATRQRPVQSVSSPVQRPLTANAGLGAHPADIRPQR